jgi:hypothetical protein
MISSPLASGILSRVTALEYTEKEGSSALVIDVCLRLVGQDRITGMSGDEALRVAGIVCGNCDDAAKRRAAVRFVWGAVFGGREERRPPSIKRAHAAAKRSRVF